MCIVDVFFICVYTVIYWHGGDKQVCLFTLWNISLVSRFPNVREKNHVPRAVSVQYEAL